MTYLPYPYRTRPAERRWSEAEAAWTRREQGLPLVATTGNKPNHAARRARMLDAMRTMRRGVRRARAIAARRAFEPMPKREHLQEAAA